MTGKDTLLFRRTSRSKLVTLLVECNILPWLVCGLAAAFYCYEYLLRIAPGLMVPELQKAFRWHGEYLDATLVGYLSSFYYYAYMPTQLPAGLVLDRYGPRRVLTLAVLGCALGAMVFGHAETWGVAAAGRFFMGLGSAFAFVGVLKLASIWLPPHRFAFVAGLTTTLGMVGAMLGTLIMTKLIQRIGWQLTMIEAGGYVGLALVLFVAFVVRDAPPKGHAWQPSATTSSYSVLWQEIKEALKNSQIWLSGLIGGLLFIPVSVVAELWGNPFLQVVYHLRPQQAAQAIGMIFLGWAIGGPVAGFLSDALKRRKELLCIGALLATLTGIVLLCLPNPTVWEVEGMLFLLGLFSSPQVICFAISKENCPSHLAGTAVAVTNCLVTCLTFSQVLVGGVLDWAWDGTIQDHVKAYNAHSYRVAMLVLPIATGLAFVISLFLKGGTSTVSDSSKV